MKDFWDSEGAYCSSYSKVFVGLHSRLVIGFSSITGSRTLDASIIDSSGSETRVSTGVSLGSMSSSWIYLSALVLSSSFIIVSWMTFDCTTAWLWQWELLFDKDPPIELDTSLVRDICKRKFSCCTYSNCVLISSIWRDWRAAILFYF